MSTFLSNGSLQEETVRITTSSQTYVLGVNAPTIVSTVGSGAQLFKMGDAQTMVPGIRFYVTNRTSDDSTLTVNYDDNTLLTTVLPASQVEIRLISNLTTNGVWDVSQSGGGFIGVPPDGDYTDGLFIDFTPTTTTGDATDRFNEVLKQLAPPPAPNLSSIDLTTGGVNCRLSFGTGHPISGYTPVGTDAGNAAVGQNGLYSVSGTRRGAYAGGTRQGYLAATVTAQSQNCYPAKSFGYADQGTLSLSVNGTILQTVDLSTFVSGDSFNGNGSGFVSLSAKTPVQFPNGTPFTVFYYRTGQWRVTYTDMRSGFNYAKVTHTRGAVVSTTNYEEWVIDPEPTALAAASGSLTGLTMTGTKYLSGVCYHTGGTATYGVTINNAQKNIYSDGYALTFPFVTNCTVPSQTLPLVSTPSWELAPIIVSAVATVVATRILNGSIAVAINCTHPLKTGLTGVQSQSISGILLDNVATVSTDTREYFDNENIRLLSTQFSGVNNYVVQADVVTGAWNSQISLTTGSAGYTNGLLYYNSTSCYPTQGANGGNFGGITNGPPGNPDYSAASGNRYFYIKIKNNSGSSRFNFTIILQGTGSFTSASSLPSGQALTLEMKFPTGSVGTGTGWLDCYGDFMTDQYNDLDGCRMATLGLGRAFATTWGLTIGTKVLAANEYLVFRLGAASTWTGNVSDFQISYV